MTYNIRSTNLRFNLEKDTPRRAWEYLQRMDKMQFKSYSHAVAIALVEYFDRYYRTQDVKHGNGKNALCSRLFPLCRQRWKKPCPCFSQAAWQAWVSCLCQPGNYRVHPQMKPGRMPVPMWTGIFLEDNPKSSPCTKEVNPWPTFSP